MKRLLLAFLITCFLFGCCPSQQKEHSENSMTPTSGAASTRMIVDQFYDFTCHFEKYEYLEEFVCYISCDRGMVFRIPCEHVPESIIQP
jgi:hypothetical protein